MRIRDLFAPYQACRMPQWGQLTDVLTGPSNTVPQPQL